VPSVRRSPRSEGHLRRTDGASKLIRDLAGLVVIFFSPEVVQSPLPWKKGRPQLFARAGDPPGISIRAETSSRPRCRDRNNTAALGVVFTFERRRRNLSAVWSPGHYRRPSSKVRSYPVNTSDRAVPGHIQGGCGPEQVYRETCRRDEPPKRAFLFDSQCPRHPRNPVCRTGSLSQSIPTKSPCPRDAEYSHRISNRTLPKSP